MARQEYKGYDLVHRELEGKTYVLIVKGIKIIHVVDTIPQATEWVDFFLKDQEQNDPD